MYDGHVRRPSYRANGARSLVTTTARPVAKGVMVTTADPPGTRDRRAQYHPAYDGVQPRPPYAVTNVMVLVRDHQIEVSMMVTDYDHHTVASMMVVDHDHHTSATNHP